MKYLIEIKRTQNNSFVNTDFFFSQDKQNNSEGKEPPEVKALSKCNLIYIPQMMAPYSWFPAEMGKGTSQMKADLKNAFNWLDSHKAALYADLKCKSKWKSSEWFLILLYVDRGNLISALTKISACQLSSHKFKNWRDKSMDTSPSQETSVFWEVIVWL